MDLRNFMRRYAEEIGGESNEYSPEFIIIIVPVSGGRAQTVLGEVKHNDLYNRKIISFTSKVCPAQADMDYQSLLTQTGFLNYSRFVIQENYVQVQAVAAFENIAESTVKEMVQEVANVADQFEMKITGADVPVIFPTPQHQTISIFARKCKPFYRFPTCRGEESPGNTEHRTS